MTATKPTLDPAFIDDVDAHYAIKAIKQYDKECCSADYTDVGELWRLVADLVNALNTNEDAWHPGDPDSVGKLLRDEGGCNG